MKVFLSSTGRDLEPHRKCAFDAIQGLGFHCIQMEHFHGPAVPIEVFDEKKVAECDLFVGILGLRHGTCPDGSEQSYTELEYAAALKLKKPRFVFLAPEDFPVPGDLIEDDVKRGKQRKFRERVHGLIRNTFTSAENLGTQIVQAVREWEQTQDKTIRTGTFLPLPPTPYFAHPYPLQENFTGRLRERRMLTEWLTGDRNVLSIVAIGGMGKSALTWAWLQRDVLGFPLPAVPEADGGEYRVPDAARPEGVLWWSFYEREASFGSFVREALRYASDGRADPKATLYDQLRELASLLSQRRLLLVLDGFERELRAYAGLNAAYQGDEFQEVADIRSCIDPRAADFLRWIAAAPIRSRIVLASRLHPKELDGLARCQRNELTALDPEDAVHFFHSQGVKGTRAEIQTACEPYGYHPLALRLLARVIVRDHRNPGDVSVAARHPVSAELKGKAGHHILQVAYDALKHTKRDLLSRLAAFRGSIMHEAVVGISPYGSEANLDAALDELIDRGLLLFDYGHARYEMHPVVRHYAYDRLMDKTGVHTSLRDYFARVPALDPDELGRVDDLAPVIELYHHTVKAGQYDEALSLFQDRLGDPLYYRFGAYQACIELVRGLFPAGEDHPPKLKTKSAQSWAQDALANSYGLSGQSRRAVPLFLKSIATHEKAANKGDLAQGLRIVADEQFRLGQLGEAEKNLRRAIKLSREVNDAFQEAASHQELERLQAYQGCYDESSSELDVALFLFRKLDDKQGEGIVMAYRAQRALLMKDAKEALDYARRSRELADVKRVERDIIRAEWLLGWALIQESSVESEQHLSEALTRCRRINLVESEPDILLALARWHCAAGNPTAAREHADEALMIADRCEYRLVQADVHNFLAQLALDANDRSTARHHAEIARERAWCDGPPHCYKPALDEAESLLAAATAAG
jgi:tetratricopeptide (TPR) repeat protein